MRTGWGQFVVTRDVPVKTTVVGILARPLSAKADDSFMPYGIPTDLEEITHNPEKLRAQLGMMKARLNALEAAMARPPRYAANRPEGTHPPK